MTDDLLALGVDAFNVSFNEELAKGEGKVFRAGGRPTKAMPNGEDEGWWRANAPAMIQSWISWRAQNPNLHVWTVDGVPAIELQVRAEVDLADGTKVALKGFIDRVFIDSDTGQLLIVDLKSGKNAPAPPAIRFLQACPARHVRCRRTIRRLLDGTHRNPVHRGRPGCVL